MFKSFKISFNLKNTYRVNSIIYALKRFPILGKLLPQSLYDNKALKILANIISAFIEIIETFGGKALYIFLMIFLVTNLYEPKSANNFIHIFTLLTICGGFLNTYMFNPSKDKYYAMVIMNMDARKYTLSNYYCELIKVIIGFLPFTILFGLISKVPFWICMLLPIFVVMVKMIVSALCLLDFEKNRNAKNENIASKSVYGLIAILLVLAYGLPYFKIAITPICFLAIFAISLLLGLLSFIKINNFKYYRKMYKQILTQDSIEYVKTNTSADAIKESVQKKIEYSDVVNTSNKKGFAFFHEIFVKRHKKVLTEAVKKQAIVIFLIFFVVSIVIMIYPKFKQKINDIMLTSLPYLVFVMYLLNRGTVYTQALFMNCDHSMLTFRIYRTPRVILGLFKERLKTIIFVNMIPAMVIAIGLPFLLFITGGTDNILNYGILFFSIIAMSVFFSVHYLVMYYLLQPYNIGTEIKSSTYKFVQFLTYIVCYYMIKLKLPTLYFGIAMIIFSIVYCGISLILAYKYAPKTFKIHD